MGRSKKSARKSKHPRKKRPRRATRSIFPFPASSAPLAPATLIRQTYEELQRIFLSIGFSLSKGRKLKPLITTSRPSISPSTIPPATIWTPFTSKARVRATCCAPTLRRCRFAPWKSKSLPCASSCPEKSIAAIIQTPARLHVSSDRRARRRYGHHLLRLQGHRRILRPGFLGPQAKTRLRPSYFPFTEPSAEVDATCHVSAAAAAAFANFLDG